MAKKKGAKKGAQSPRKSAEETPAAANTSPPETTSADTPEKQAPIGKRVISVTSRTASFQRAAIRFNNREPIVVKEAEIGTERFEKILAEKMLRCDAK